jgi:hypothetical protein
MKKLIKIEFREVETIDENKKNKFTIIIFVVDTWNFDFL